MTHYWQKNANQNIMKTIENMDHYGWENFIKVTCEILKECRKEISDGQN